jgi:hypothetical protein
VLIDGLDEVMSATGRAGVIDSITSFVIAQQPRGNRIVCTSRISGYAAAPLPHTFTALRLLEMDNASIKRFLDGYVPAIERSEAPDKTAALISQDAQRTITELLAAFRDTPGIRRLAANPLLLTALLLVHRTMGSLPERRVDAYKAVVDALGRTWRAKQGVPEAELPDERQLTEWLTVLAAWMHAERPEGSATLSDLLKLLGPRWADMQRRDWDAKVLDAADPASTDAGAGILAFVEQVERHCGLLVERAPRRWGFPHLTFEEFYAGRALAFPRRVQDRPPTIREHLPDPRYEEPILLALGLVGRDYASQIDDLVNTALLARGADADQLGLTPSPLEHLLGRDFRFALRALADDIPVGPRLMDELLNQALDETLNGTGRGRFHVYRRALLTRIVALNAVGAGTRLVDLLAARISNDPLTDRRSHQRFVELTEHCAPHPTLTERLERLATGNARPLALTAAKVLASRGQLSGVIVHHLSDLVATTHDSALAGAAAGILADQGELPIAIISRLTDLTASTGDVNATVAEVLARQKELPLAILERFSQLITDTDPLVAFRATEVLAAQRRLGDTVVQRLGALITTHADSFVADMAVRVLARQAELPAAIVDSLSDVLRTTDDGLLAIRAAQVLAGQAELPPAVVKRLSQLVSATHDSRVVLGAADVLAGQGELAVAIVERLIDLIATSADSPTEFRAMQLLSDEAHLPSAIVEHLTELIATADDRTSGMRATAVLACQADLPAETIGRLSELLATSDDTSVAMHAAEALAGRCELPVTMLTRLRGLIASTDDSLVASAAAQLLADHERLSDVIVERLSGLLTAAGDGFQARALHDVLATQIELPITAAERLGEFVATTDDTVMARSAARVLAAQVQLPSRVVERLSTTAEQGHIGAYTALWRS